MYAFWGIYQLCLIFKDSRMLYPISSEPVQVRENINYLDDFLFTALIRAICNKQIKEFLAICALICFPVSLEKTVWACCKIVFLGLILDTVNQVIRIPQDKIDRAISMILYCTSKKKIKLRDLQKLCGFLNFLCKAIVPGRAFTRRIYAHGNKLTKKDHHLKVTKGSKIRLGNMAQFLEISFDIQ